MAVIKISQLYLSLYDDETGLLERVILYPTKARRALPLPDPGVAAIAQRSQ